MASSLIQGDIDASIRSFKFNQAALTRLLTHPNGEVAADLVRRAIRVEAAAKQNASGRPGPMVRTGRLRGSITWRLGADHKSLYADIGSAVVYAPFVEFGTANAPAYPFLRPALAAARL